MILLSLLPATVMPFDTKRHTQSAQRRQARSIFLVLKTETVVALSTWDPQPQLSHSSVATPAFIYRGPRGVSNTRHRHRFQQCGTGSCCSGDHTTVSCRSFHPALRHHAGRVSHTSSQLTQYVTTISMHEVVYPTHSTARTRYSLDRRLKTKRRTATAFYVLS